MGGVEGAVRGNVRRELKKRRGTSFRKFAAKTATPGTFDSKVQIPKNSTAVYLILLAVVRSGTRRKHRGPPLAQVNARMAFWDERAARYEDGTSGAWHASISQALIEAVAPRPGERLLDVGCGTGLCALAAARRGAVVTGIDKSPAMVASARTKAAEMAGLSSTAMFETGDAQHLEGIAPASFDVLTASAVVPYLPDPPSALRRWREVLRPGGRAAFHGFHGASVLGDLTSQAAAIIGIPLEFERWTGSAELCAGLLRQAGFESVTVSELPIVGDYSVAEAKASLARMFGAQCNPLLEPAAAALRADPTLLPALQSEYDRVVDAAAAAEPDGRLHTRGQCFIAVGTAS